MSRIYEFTIPGEPMGKQRPRFTTRVRGINHVRTYTSKNTVMYENLVRNIATQHAQMIEGPLKVDIKAYFPVPKSYTKKRREACLAGIEYPTKKPDKDNIEKIILDGMNPTNTKNVNYYTKGFYRDDCQVVAGSTSKLYSTTPRVEVVVTELGE